MDWLSRLETFVRVVEAGSLSRAARSLRLSPPAVSRQLASLEAELGVALSVRTTRKFALTAEGERFCEHARRALREVELAKQSTRPDGAMLGLLTVSASVAFGIEKLIPRLKGWLDCYRGLRLDLRLEDHATELVDEGIDVAVRAGMTLPNQAGLLARELKPAPRVFVAAPEYLKRKGTPRTPEDMVQHDLIWGTGPGRDATIAFQRKGVSAILTLRPRLRVGTLLGLREAAVAGLGIAVLTQFVAEKELRRKRLVQVLQHLQLPQAQVHALYRLEYKSNERVGAFVSFLQTL